MSSKANHVQEDCDRWLSTTNRKKIVKEKSTRIRPSFPILKKSPLYQLNLTQTRIEIKATKQTAVTSYFKQKESKSEGKPQPSLTMSEESSHSSLSSQNQTLVNLIENICDENVSPSNQQSQLKSYLDIQSTKNHVNSTTNQKERGECDQPYSSIWHHDGSNMSYEKSCHENRLKCQIEAVEKEQDLSPIHKRNSSKINKANETKHTGEVGKKAACSDKRCRKVLERTCSSGSFISNDKEKCYSLEESYKASLHKAMENNVNYQKRSYMDDFENELSVALDKSDFLVQQNTFQNNSKDKSDGECKGDKAGIVFFERQKDRKKGCILQASENIVRTDRQTSGGFDVSIITSKHELHRKNEMSRSFERSGESIDNLNEMNFADDIEHKIKCRSKSFELKENDNSKDRLDKHVTKCKWTYYHGIENGSECKTDWSGSTKAKEDQSEDKGRPVTFTRNKTLHKRTINSKNDNEFFEFEDFLPEFSESGRKKRKGSSHDERAWWRTKRCRTDLKSREWDDDDIAIEFSQCLKDVEQKRKREGFY